MCHIESLSVGRGLCPIGSLVPIGPVPWVGAVCSGDPMGDSALRVCAMGQGLDALWTPRGGCAPIGSLPWGKGCVPHALQGQLCHCVAGGDPPVPAMPWHHGPLLCAADNPGLLTIQPDLSTATMTYQGSLCPRQDGPAKLQLPNGHLLSPLGAGRHTLHHSSPAAEGADFVARLSTQSYFRSLPRGTTNMAYGTFNFLGGRLMIPNTGMAGWAWGARAALSAGGPLWGSPPCLYPPTTQGSACSSHPMPSHGGRSMRST